VPAPHQYLHSSPTRRSSDLDENDVSHIRCSPATRARKPSKPVSHRDRHPKPVPGAEARSGGLFHPDAPPLPSARLRHRLEPCARSEEHTSELQSRENLVCRL